MKQFVHDEFEMQKAKSARDHGLAAWSRLRHMRVHVPVIV
jgi:hypothetical protein